MTTSWYSITITQLIGGLPIFTGFFSVVNLTSATQGIVTSFYDYSNPSVNIYINNNYAGADSIFITSSSYSFTFGGVNITSFPYFNNAPLPIYNLYYSSPTIISVFEKGDYNATFSLLPGIPTSNIGGVPKLVTKDLIINTIKNVSKKIVIKIQFSNLEFIITNKPEHGVLKKISSNTYLYTPDYNFIGLDSFRYK